MAADALQGHCPKCLARTVFGPAPEPQSQMKEPVDPKLAGQTIGRYKLLEQIGEGGFGVVYMAEQLEPVQRKVALKIIKAGMDSRQIIARFEAERQALALMDHPNIARVLDAGTTETGRPYFVMELVRGIAITEYCDEKQLSTSERLQLFMKVCQAIQHAHQKAIIHRDIKPSNILVTLHDGEPVPKVIDFGIAKALDQKLTDKTLFTGFAQMMGTPAYMSPEQAELSGLDVDTRSDIYSLGVLLYELLTGVTPFDRETLLKAGLDEIRRLIRETDPPKPSTRLQTLGAKAAGIATKRQTDPASLRRLLTGDLDWIVMKCLEKDRQRRYGAANTLASDVERYLIDEPVSAAAPSAAYRIGKFVRRNKAAFFMGSALVLLLLAATFVSATHAIRAKRSEKHAIIEAGKSKQVAQLLKDMLQGVGPSVAKGRDTQMLQEILDKTRERIATELKNQPEVEIDIRMALGSVYLDLSQYSLAESMFNQARALSTNISNYPQENVADQLKALANALHHKSQLDLAEQNLRLAMEIYRRLFGETHRKLATCLQGLAEIREQKGEYTEAERLYRETVAMKLTVFDKESDEVADSLHGLSEVLTAQGKYDEAEVEALKALEMRKKVSEPDSQGIAVSLSGLAHLKAQKGKFDEAESLENQALDLRKRVLGQQHPETATTLGNLGLLLWQAGKFEKAESTLREAIALRRRLPRGDASGLRSNLGNLAGVLMALNRPEDAETVMRESLALQQELFGNESPDVAHDKERLAAVLARQKKVNEAIDLQREALAFWEHSKNDSWESYWTKLNLGIYLVLQQKYDQAEPLLDSGYKGLKERENKLPGMVRERLDKGSTPQAFVRLYEATGRPAEAAEWKRKL